LDVLFEACILNADGRQLAFASAVKQQRGICLRGAFSLTRRSQCSGFAFLFRFERPETFGSWSLPSLGRCFLSFLQLCQPVGQICDLKSLTIDEIIFLKRALLYVSWRSSITKLEAPNVSARCNPGPLGYTRVMWPYACATTNSTRVTCCV
jgi:hypothetical protein